MKQIIIALVIALAIANVTAQESINSTQVLYTANASHADESQSNLPTHTYAAEEIVTTGEVKVASATKVVFQTLPAGSIHLKGQFQVEQGAFFHAYKSETVPRADLEAHNIINSTSLKGTLTGYPNPFMDKLFVEFELSEISIANIHLFDVRGKLVKTVFTNRVLDAGLQKLEINAVDLSIGTYFCQIQLNTVMHTATFAKIK